MSILATFRTRGLCCGLFAGALNPAHAADALPPRAAPNDFPGARYAEMAANGSTVLCIDTASSLVVIEVGRAGPLFALGHDHVVASHGLAGYVAPLEGVADLYVPLSRLMVDEQALRAKANLDTQPTQDEIALTHSHMLEMLEEEKFPHAVIRASGTLSARDSADLTLSLTLHGSTRTLHVPARVTALDNGTNVSGRLAFNLTDFGITPYSVFGGAVKVRDRVDLQFDIRALRCSGGGSRP